MNKAIASKIILLLLAGTLVGGLTTYQIYNTMVTSQKFKKQTECINTVLDYCSQWSNFNFDPASRPTWWDPDCGSRPSAGKCKNILREKPPEATTTSYTITTTITTSTTTTTTITTSTTTIPPTTSTTSTTTTIPPLNCDSYCQDLGYATGVCRSGSTFPTSFFLYRYKSLNLSHSAAELAQYLDMSQSWEYTGSRVQEIHSIRPDFKALFYRDVTAVYTYWPDEWELFKANNWVLKDINGDYVYSPKYGSYMYVDVGNPDYQQWVANKINEKINQYGFNGVFADNGLYVTNGVFESGSSDAINPRTGTYWTNSEVKQAYLGLHQKIKEVIGSKLLIANGIWRGRDFYNHQSDYVEVFQNSPMDGLMSEGIWYTYNTYWFTENMWKDSLDFLIWVQQNYLEGTNKYFVPVCSHRRNPTGVTNAELSNYCTASMLLGIQAGQKQIYFHNGDIVFLKDYGQELFDKANSIGDPLGNYYIDNGVYVRDFSNGKALVNPTTSSHQVYLDQEYENLDGQIISGYYTLYPHTGEILFKTTTTPVCLSGETGIGQDGCASGYNCCCSGGVTTTTTTLTTTTTTITTSTTSTTTTTIPDGNGIDPTCANNPGSKGCYLHAACPNPVFGTEGCTCYDGTNCDGVDPNGCCCICISMTTTTIPTTTTTTSSTTPTITTTTIPSGEYLAHIGWEKFNIGKNFGRSYIESIDLFDDKNAPFWNTYTPAGGQGYAEVVPVFEDYLGNKPPNSGNKVLHMIRDTYHQYAFTIEAKGYSGNPEYYDEVYFSRWVYYPYDEPYQTDRGVVHGAADKGWTWGAFGGGFTLAWRETRMCGVNEWFGDTYTGVWKDNDTYYGDPNTAWLIMGGHPTIGTSYGMWYSYLIYADRVVPFRLHDETGCTNDNHGYGVWPESAYAEVNPFGEIPVNRWIKEEFYLKRTTDFTGEFKFWITDPKFSWTPKVIMDIRGVRTTWEMDGPLLMLKLLKMRQAFGHYYSDEIYLYNYNAHEEGPTTTSTSSTTTTTVPGICTPGNDIIKKTDYPTGSCQSLDGYEWSNSICGDTSVCKESSCKLVDADLTNYTLPSGKYARSDTISIPYTIKNVGDIQWCFLTETELTKSDGINIWPVKYNSVSPGSSTLDSLSYQISCSDPTGTWTGYLYSYTDQVRYGGWRVWGIPYYSIEVVECKDDQDCVNCLGSDYTCDLSTNTCKSTVTTTTTIPSGDYLAYTGFESPTTVNGGINNFWVVDVSKNWFSATNGVGTKWKKIVGTTTSKGETITPKFGDKMLEFGVGPDPPKRWTYTYQFNNGWIDEVYQSAWVYFPSTYDTTDRNWHVLFEIRNDYPDGDSIPYEGRFGIGLEKYADGIYWNFHLDHAPPPRIRQWDCNIYPEREDYYWYDNTTDTYDTDLIEWNPILVPKGRWWRWELYYKRDYTNGIFTMWITDPENPDSSLRHSRVLINVTGQTKHSDTKVDVYAWRWYGQDPAGTANTFVYWVDDVYVYDYNAHGSQT